jgi:hypothetical protein
MSVLVSQYLKFYVQIQHFWFLSIAILILVRYKVSGFREQGTGNKEFKLAYLTILGNAINYSPFAQ